MEPQHTPRSESAKTGSSYEPPVIRVMDEKEVLQVFQITSAGATWWAM